MIGTMVEYMNSAIREHPNEVYKLMVDANRVLQPLGFLILKKGYSYEYKKIK